MRPRFEHVPMLEAQAAEAVEHERVRHGRTSSMLPTAVVSNASCIISTDKAAGATSVMGASKWLAEQVVRCLEGGARTFCAVQFGNVLGSRGSVIPTFQRQIAARRPGDRRGPVDDAVLHGRA